MISIKGFVEIPSFANNAAGVTAPLGELSPQSKTYSTEIAIYTSATYPQINLRMFNARNEAEANVIPSNHQIDVAFLVMGHTYNQMLLGLTGDRTDYLNNLLTQFAAQIESVDCGAIVTGAYDLPQWVSWKNVGEEEYYRLWFSDGAFKNQYDLSEIKVVLPFDDIDQFFNHPNTVKALLATMTPTLMVTELNDAIGTSPQTNLRVMSFDYVNPYNQEDKTVAYFGVVIYGWIGNNLDSIKDAIVAAILAQSTHTREEWMAILPDLFRRTEFVIIPLFDSYAIPNMTLQAGIYSPIKKVSELTQYGLDYTKDYPQAHVTANIQVMSLTYRSLIAAVIGNIENLDSKFAITDHFPDYIAVPSTSTDFNRMELTTQQWAILLETAVQLAEIYNFNTDMLPNLSRVRRDTLNYIAFAFNNVQYLVPIKTNFPE